MSIMYCAKCGFPVADSFHDFERVCSCIPIEEQKKRAKQKGWDIKFPKEQKNNDTKREIKIPNLINSIQKELDKQQKNSK